MEQYLSENKTVIYKVVAIKELTVLGVCKTSFEQGQKQTRRDGLFVSQMCTSSRKVEGDYLLSK